MNRWGKISWLLFALSVVILIAVRTILGGWVWFLWIPLGLALVSFVGALAVDYKLYLEFLTMRTTKHGMNMGALILIMLVALVSVNILGVRFNRTIDLTEEKLNSLADQSRKVIDNLSDDMQIKVFFRNEKDDEDKAQLKQSLSLYQEYSSRVRVRYINAYAELAEASQYLKESDKSGMAVFVEYQGRRVRIETPFNEQNITSSMVQATREKRQKIYFVSGHGERNITDTDAEGLTEFKEALTDASYDVAALSLIDESGRIPEDADVVAIVGPKSQYFEAELKSLNAFAARGGRFLVALDPGQRSGLEGWLKSWGVDFKNNYVINEIAQIIGRGAGSALGVEFSGESPATEIFAKLNDQTVFDLASELVIAEPHPSELKYREIIKTHNSSFAVLRIDGPVTRTAMRPHVVALDVHGKWPAALAAGAAPAKDAGSNAAEFAAIVVGDSDFLSNKSVMFGLNRDFGLSSVAYLTQQNDLISITPKRPRGTTLQLTSTQQSMMVLGGISLPLILFVFGGIAWYRRKNS